MYGRLIVSVVSVIFFHVKHVRNHGVILIVTNLVIVTRSGMVIARPMTIFDANLRSEERIWGNFVFHLRRNSFIYGLVFGLLFEAEGRRWVRSDREHIK